jgi:hypothetical protein
MIWILVILGFVVFYFLFGRKKKIIPNPPDPDPTPDPDPDPGPDPTFYRWQLVDKTTKRWAKYLLGMAYVNSDTWMAYEMVKKDENGKRFYVWTAETGDYWDLPDEVFEKGKVDCDGFARLTTDGLKRFAKVAEVWWMEYYGYYRVYVYDPETGEYSYQVIPGGHAITAYRKEGKLLAFSNTQWWHDKGFLDFLDIGEETFPEGLFRVVCRHWETGKAQWIEVGKEGEILKGTNVFHRKLVKVSSIRKLSKKDSKGAMEWRKLTK